MTTQNTTHIIILAAGNGTRMQSTLPKVMHQVGNLPLLGHVLKNASPLQGDVCVVLAPAMDSVAEFALTLYPNATIASQNEQLGTAHAVSCALDKMSIDPDDHVLVLCGDTPILQSTTIQAIADTLTLESATGMVVAGMHPDDPKAYGRLICDDCGQLNRIVEFKHASDAEKEITFCNAGIMAFKGDCLQKVLPKIQQQDSTGEYYLTDAVELANAQNYRVATIEIPPHEAEGVNTRRDLSQAEFWFQAIARNDALEKGCTLIDPETVYFSHDTVIDQDVLIEPNVFFGPGVHVHQGSHIKAFSHIEGAAIGENATVGPFARLRPGTDIGENARIGNFVEVKNARLDKGAKANHLSYIGDATVGEKANVGAGTITCNYDGYLKHKTVIGKEAFIGSNSCLVAPITIEDGAIVGAGSTVTKNVEKDALCVARSPQKAFPGKAKAFRTEKEKLKKAKQKVA